VNLPIKLNSVTGRLIAFLVVMALAIVSAQFLVEPLQYKRSLIINGEYWRLLTGHFCHLGWRHLAMNGIGLGMIAWLFGALYSPWYWFVSSLLCVLSISLGFLLFVPALEGYVGLSGLLHGLLVMGLIGELRKGNWLYGIVLIALVAKLVAENMTPISHDMSAFIGGRVVTEAHLYGALSGGAIALLAIPLNRLWQSQFPSLNTG